MTEWHVPADGWELVEYRNGGWNSVNRVYGPMAYITLAQWQASNGGGRKTTLRPVTADTSLLSNSPYPYIQVNQEEDVPDRKTTAHDDGYIFANRLADIFSVNPSSDVATLFAIARTFAKFEGYADADGAFAYVQGFVEGFRGPQPKQLASKSPSDTTTVVDGNM